MKTKQKSLQLSIFEQPKTNRESLVAIIVDSVISITLFLGIIGNIKNLIMPDVMFQILIAIGIICCFGFCYLIQNKKTKLLGVAISLAWIVLYCLILKTDIFNGLRLTGTHFGEVLGKRFGNIYPIYAVTINKSGYRLSATLFFIPIIILISLLSSYIAKNSDTIISLIIISAIISANAFLNVQISGLWILIFIVAELLIILKSITRFKFFCFTSINWYCISTLAVTVLFIVCSLSCYFIISPKSITFKEEKESVIRSVDKLRYGLNNNFCMPDGDFTNLKAFSPSTKPSLEVTMEKPESLWLRGYIGSVYNKKGWDCVPSEKLYNNSDMFYWLHKSNFYGQNQLANSSLVSGNDLIKSSFGIKIKNLSASSRNIYAPYEFYLSSQNLMTANMIGDESLKSTGFFGKREYEYISLPNIVKRYPDILNVIYNSNNKQSSIEDYLNLEANYSEFVYSNYTIIPKDTKMWMNKYLPDFKASNDDINFTTAKQKIIIYLTENTSYSANPSKSTGKDFAYDFLFTNRTGYSVHYATAATLIFRYMGIPARYVEGYIITPDDIKSAQKNVLLKIDSTHAHAWTEVYLNGVGWIPVEVTPKYFGVMQEADSYEGVNGESFDSENGETNSDDSYKIQDDLLGLDETNGIKSTPKAILISCILICILLICLIVYFINKRRMWISIHLKKCINNSNRIAVKAMFNCSMEALTLIGLKTNGVWLTNTLKYNISNVSNDLSEDFEKAFYSYEKAVYSSLDISDNDRTNAICLLKEVHFLLIKRYKGIKRFKVSKYLKLFTKCIKYLDIVNDNI